MLAARLFASMRFSFACVNAVCDFVCLCTCVKANLCLVKYNSCTQNF